MEDAQSIVEDRLKDLKMKMGERIIVERSYERIGNDSDFFCLRLKLVNDIELAIQTVS
jgi:hypothetical protein